MRSALTRPRPVISIGVPVYNGARYLTPAIESLLAQSFDDFDMIISDNASTDETPKICTEFMRRDPRVRYVRQPQNIGGPRNWSFVARQAQGQYFKWAAANDVCHRDMLLKCKQVLDEQPGAVLVFPRTQIIDEIGRPGEVYEDVLELIDTDPCERFVQLLSRIGLNNAQHGLIRTAPLLQTGLEAPYPASDITLLAELALHGTFVQLPEVLFFRRVAAGATTLLQTPAEVRHFNDPLRRYGASFPLWRASLGRIATVWRASLTPRQRTRLSLFVIRRMRGDRDRLWNEIVSEVRLRLGGSG
jgi:glycosyltransferase involved in cell wall biosynthesis